MELLKNIILQRIDTYSLSDSQKKELKSRLNPYSLV